jgi:hypothetical protein
MTHQPNRQAWDDDRIDRVLRQAVSVDPSPALRARVRARVAAEPAPSTRSFGLWTAMAAGAAGAAIMLAAIAGRGWNAPGTTLLPIAARWGAVAVVPYPASIQPAAIELPMAVPPIASTPRARQALVLTSAASASRAAPQFAPGDRAAFALLLAFSRSGRLLPPESLPPVNHDLDVVVPAIEFTAIDIPALVLSGAGEGASK